MSYTPRWQSIIAALGTAMALAACGGGGSDGATPTSSTPPANNPPPVAGTGAPTLTGNIAVDGRNWINYRRGQAGVPTLTENAQINVAALGHSEYQRVNNTMTHDQVAGRQGFTGVTLGDA